ncbi:MAG TPA: polysaccharide deacetylase family protein [Chthoniobacteraceae bacterium]|nr:polysaccharide deacetylase family protein [Chthoniobacteraceae bacterium]
MSARALVVSLHDVSPLTHQACDRIVSQLASLGVPRVSLLVIPNHHGRGHFSTSPEFCAWVRARAAEGHEIVTHGYFHRRERREKEGVVQRMATRVYTADEGEFYDIERPHAAELVGRANTELREAGLQPRGFIAPAWLLSDEGEAALKDEGCEYTTRLRTVTDLRNSRIHSAQSLCWSVRAAWRRSMSLAWNALLYRALRSEPLLRISIHPVDIEHRPIWAQISYFIQNASTSRSPMTYFEWITAQR